MSFDSYLPRDRALAIASGTRLPDRAVGTLLYARLVGLSPLTEALPRVQPARQAAETLHHHLTPLYNHMVKAIHRFGGSVVHFSGDSLLCWFDDSVLRPLASALRAVVCAQHLQKAVSPAGALTLDSGQRFPLSLQVALLAGPIRRFLVGDPAVYQLDLLAGAALDRVLTTEALAAPGEIVLDQQTAQLIDSRVQRLTWRIDPASANRYALVPLWATANVPPAPLVAPRLGLPQVRPLLLPFVAQPLKVGMSELPAELRHVTLLGLRCAGMDYDGSAGAAALLDGLVRKMQQLLHPYGGVLLQLAASTKATTILMAFGVPNATATDDERAVRAAQELLTLPQQLPWMRGLHIGVHQGLGYVGGYGSSERRSYGVFGEAVHGAERLAQASSPGTLLASLPVAQHTSSAFVWESAGSLPQKGKNAAIAALRLVGDREVVQTLEERIHEA